MSDQNDAATTPAPEQDDALTRLRLAPGDVAPDFTLPDADGHVVTLPTYRGSKVVLYFYPAAGTPGCTAQACDFRDSLSEFEGAGFAVLGISPDETGALATFRDERGLTFPLLSDPGHGVLEAYGAWGEKSSYGKKTVGVVRSTIVVDEHGRVERAAYNVKATGHVARLSRELGLAS